MGFLVSRRSRWRPKDSRPCVRPSVRTYVTLLLENCSLLFSETLQLVRACKCEKNVPSAFLKKNPVLPILAKNCPKLTIWLDYPAGVAGNPRKKLKAGVLETNFKQIPFVFRQTTCTYSESWDQ